MKTLLLLVTALCLLLAYISEPLMVEHRNRRILAELASKGVRTSSVGLLNVDQTLRRTLVSYLGVPAYPHLYALDFSAAKLEEVDLSQLQQLYAVRDLNFCGTSLTDGLLEQLSDHPYLLKLDLSLTQVTDESVKSLTRFRNLASLNVLGTKVSYLTLEKLDGQLEFAHFAEERAIDEWIGNGFQADYALRHINHAQDGDAGKLSLSTVTAGIKAEYAVVGMKGSPMPFSAKDVEHLNHLASLREIDFHQVHFGSEGLTKLKRLKHLRTMELWFVNLQDADLEALTRQTQLEKLEIHYADQITDDGIEHLPSLSNLTELKISNCPGVSEQAIDKLRQHLPNCQIEFSTW